MEFRKQANGTNNDILEEARKIRGFTFTYDINHEPAQSDYQVIVDKWEVKTNKSFGELIAELRRKHSPEEVISILGVSKGFIYYNYGLYMNRIAYLEHIHKMPLGELVNKMRNKGKTMEEISDNFGLAVTTLYNHLRKIS